MKPLLRFVAVLGILAVPAVAGAQVTRGIRVRISDLRFNPIPTFDLRNLPGLDIFATVPLNDVVEFQPEALIDVHGGGVSQQGTPKDTIDYVEVPLLGRFRVAKGSPLVVFAGPSFGVRTHVGVTGTGIEVDFSHAFEDSVKWFDVGRVAGAGLEADHMVLDGRYTWGLTNRANPRSTSSGARRSATHRVFSLSAGVRF